MVTWTGINNGFGGRNLNSRGRRGFDAAYAEYGGEYYEADDNAEKFWLKVHTQHLSISVLNACFLVKVKTRRAV